MSDTTQQEKISLLEDVLCLIANNHESSAIREITALFAKANADFRDAENKIVAIEAEIARLRTALEWYASPRTWNQWLPDSAGDKARMALGGK